MIGIFGGKIRVGLDVGQRAIRAAGVRKGAGQGRLDWFREAPLPAGLLTDSLTEPNITDVPAFAGLLKDLLRGTGPGRRVGVALPDYVSRVSILDFDALPGNSRETEQMLRWRLKKVLPFEIEQAALRYQYLGKFFAEDGDKHRFLVSLVKADILAQYEEALKEAGLRPEVIEISTFAVWNLFHDHVLGESGGTEGFALLNISGGKLTVMVFDRGVPRFLRLKDMGKQGGDEGGGNGLDVMRVLRELTASLTFYKENYAPTPVGRVYIAGDAHGLEDIASEVRANSTIVASVLVLDKVLHGAVGGGRPLSAYGAACGAALES
jgi:Tfp pilus assembly PilM family ATPase